MIPPVRADYYATQIIKNGEIKSKSELNADTYTSHLQLISFNDLNFA